MSLSQLFKQGTSFRQLTRKFVPSASAMTRQQRHAATFSPTQQYRPDVMARREKLAEGAGHTIPNQYFMPDTSRMLPTRVEADPSSFTNSWQKLLNAMKQPPQSKSFYQSSNHSAPELSDAKRQSKQPKSFYQQTNRSAPELSSPFHVNQAVADVTAPGTKQINSEKPTENDLAWKASRKARIIEDNWLAR